MTKSLSVETTTGFRDSKKRVYFDKENCLILSTPMRETWDRSLSTPMQEMWDRSLPDADTHNVKTTFPPNQWFPHFFRSGITLVRFGANSLILPRSQVTVTARLQHYDPSLPILKRMSHPPIPAKF